MKSYLRETLYGIPCVGTAKDHSIQSSLDGSTELVTQLQGKKALYMSV